MFVLGNLVMTIANILGIVINLYTFIIIIAALITWFNVDPYNPIVRILRQLTEPIYFRIRRRFPFVVVSGLDLSPIIVLLILQLFNGVVVRSLHDFGARL